MVLIRYLPAYDKFKVNVVDVGWALPTNSLAARLGRVSFFVILSAAKDLVL